jgi:hypothetical protein
MKKSKLIELLQTIEGNPDIMLWNGIVGDVMDLKPNLGAVRLVKQTLAFYLEMCRLQDCRDKNDWSYQMPQEEVERLTDLYKSFEYEENSYVYQEDIDKGNYKQKIVYVLDAKLTGKTSYSRSGDISY